MALPYKKIVVKFGTSTITGRTNSVDYPGLIDLLRQICTLCDRGVSVTLVSSGAVAVGRDQTAVGNIYVPTAVCFFRFRTRSRAVRSAACQCFGAP